MKNKFYVSIFFGILFFITISFLFNSYVDVLNIFQTENKNNKLLFLESKNSNREKFIIPILFDNFQYKKALIGTSKGKFIYTPKDVANYSIPNLDLEDYYNYLNLISRNQKLEDIYIVIDIEQLFSRERQSLNINDFNYFNSYKKYITSDYLKESFLQIQMNNSKFYSFNTLFIEKNNIFGQKKIINFKEYKLNKDDIRDIQFRYSKKEIDDSYLKELFKINKKYKNVTFIINPSRKEILEIINKEELNKFILKLKKEGNVINLAEKYSNNEIYIDKIHYSDKIGYLIWKDINDTCR